MCLAWLNVCRCAWPSLFATDILQRVAFRRQVGNMRSSRASSFSTSFKFHNCNTSNPAYLSFRL